MSDAVAGRDAHLVQVRLSGGVLLELRTKRRLDFDRARRLARRVRRSLRLPAWSPRWSGYARAYARLAEDIRRWHDQPRRVVVEVARRSGAEAAENGWLAVLFLPVSLPRCEPRRADGLSRGDLWDRR